MPRALALDPPLSRAIVIALLFVFAAAWFAGLEYRTLLHPDEGRYAEIPLEMVATGDWLTPRLNGLKYFEKPPLQYWVTAFAYETFGAHNWSARLWPALSTFLAALFLGFVGLRLEGPSVGLYSVVGVLGCVACVISAHVLTLDAGLNVFLIVAFGAFVLAQRDVATATSSRHWMWVAWVAMAAATLSKGMVGIVIPGASLVLYTLVTRDFRVWRRLHLRSGLLIYLLLAAPWFIAVSLANDDFAHFFFIHEHFDRYLTTVHERQHGWWYFVPVVIVGAVPWLAILVWGAPHMWHDAKPGANGFSWQRFAIAWSIFVFAFFSASGSKLPAYILPIFPVLMLLVASLCERVPARTLLRHTLAGTTIVLIALDAVLLAYDAPVRRFVKDAAVLGPALALAPWVMALLTVAALGNIVAYWFLGRAAATSRTTAVLALSFSTLAACQLGLIGFDEFHGLRSSRELITAAEAANGPLQPDVPFFNVKIFDHTVPLVLGRPTTLVEYRDEFAFGESSEPEKAFSTELAWIPVWQRLDGGYAMMSVGEFDRLLASGVSMRLIVHDDARVIVARR